ncbi:uncharacterized protein LOC126701162 [Quercus robur]|uniref:uncharacterized protein LOC126701162 n=1 Tax=Quercus robur TaxID=38942 RepID=UPI0021632179|nr:uncharacterized protein LOC126701162 [Quercus robur]
MAKAALAEHSTTDQQIISFIQQYPAIEELEIQMILRGAGWTTPIVAYLKNETLPEDRDESRQLKVWVACFMLIADGLDIMGPFPMAMRQLKFLVMGINYFPNWVEAEPLATITEKNVRSFGWKSIICRFGILRVLVSDNGKQLDNDAFKDFCNQLRIKNHYFSTANPQANGQVEITNRSLFKLIKTRLEGAKGIWPDKLPSILWAYRTIV